MSEVHECDPVQVAGANSRFLCACYELVALHVVVLAGRDAAIVVELVAAQPIEAFLLGRLTQEAGISILWLGSDGKAGTGRLGDGRIICSLDAIILLLA